MGIPTAPAGGDARTRLIALAGYFLRLGATGFGGPVALCGLMERDLVERRGWLDKAQMRDIMAVCQTLPGPLAVQVGIFIGYLRCGFLGRLGRWLGTDTPRVAHGGSACCGLCASAWPAVADGDHLRRQSGGHCPDPAILVAAGWPRDGGCVPVRRGSGRSRGGSATSRLADCPVPGCWTARNCLVWPVVPARLPPSRLFDLASSLLIAKLAWFFFVTGAFTFGGGLAVVPFWKRAWCNKAIG